MIICSENLSRELDLGLAISRTVCKQRRLFSTAADCRRDFCYWPIAGDLDRYSRAGQLAIAFFKGQYLSSQFRGRHLRRFAHLDPQETVFFTQSVVGAFVGVDSGAGPYSVKPQDHYLAMPHQFGEGQCPKANRRAAADKLIGTAFLTGQQLQFSTSDFRMPNGHGLPGNLPERRWRAGGRDKVCKIPWSPSEGSL